MNTLKKGLKKALFSYRSLPEKKQYVEFFTALLTVPVLLTVITLNLNNLKGQNKQMTTTPTEKTIYVTVPPRDASEDEPTPTNKECKKSVGPVSIASPSEGETITDNPVIIDIDYDNSENCEVVWSYRINGGRFSEYGSNNIALYNPPQGTVRLELRVKSVVSNDEKLLKRTFTYEGQSTDEGTTASSSAN